MTRNHKIIGSVSNCVAKFDSTLTGNAPNNGFRVKHYVFKSLDGVGYYHISRFFVTAAVDPFCVEGVIFVSDRIFFKKYRIVERVEYYKASTWEAIVSAIEHIESLK